MSLICILSDLNMVKCIKVYIIKLIRDDHRLTEVKIDPSCLFLIDMVYILVSAAVFFLKGCCLLEIHTKMFMDEIRFLFQDNSMVGGWGGGVRDHKDDISVC